MENTPKHFRIDLREIVQSKTAGSGKKVPGFLIALLSRLVHEKDINGILERNEGLTGVDFMQSLLREFQQTLHIEGQENLPAFEHKCIFASNHPLGGLDGICLSAYLGKHYDKHIRYLVNDILYYIEPLKDLFIPINKHGGQAKDAVRALNDAFASDNQIITFPAGLCSRKERGVICDPSWKKMFIAKSVEFQRDVVPVYFEAHNSALFYRIANIRKRLGIGFNIEMLFLPHEMFKAKGSTFTIRFGKPIPWQTFDDSRTHQQWADRMKETVYSNSTLQ